MATQPMEQNRKKGIRKEGSLFRLWYDAQPTDRIDTAE